MIHLTAYFKVNSLFYNVPDRMIKKPSQFFLVEKTGKDRWSVVKDYQEYLRTVVAVAGDLSHVLQFSV